MGRLLQRVTGRYQAEASTGRPGSLHDWWYGNAGLASASGVRVNADLALTIPPFWRGVRLISENIASFSCQVHERLARGHRPAPSHPYDYTIRRAWNPDLTAYEGWESAVIHALLRGRAVALKRFVPHPVTGVERLQLWPLHPDRVRTLRAPSRALVYRVQTETGGPPVEFGVADIFHLRGMSLNGIDGAEMIAYAAQNIGAMLAAERFAQKFFKSGVTSAMVATHKEPLGDTGLENLRTSIAAYLSGLENAYGIFTTDEDVELKPIGIDPEKSQLLATRELTAVQVANWLNLPPGLLGDSKTPTFASSKQFRQDLGDLCFRPWVERFEARIDHDLLEGSGRAGDDNRFFAKFNMDALLRGDTEARSQMHQRDIVAGWKVRNEARLDEDMEPLAGLDEPLEPLNMGRTSDSRAAASAGPRIDRAALVTLQEATRLVRKEQAAATKAAARLGDDAAGWQDWLREFYGVHAAEVSERLRLPPSVAREYAGRQGLRLSERGIATIEDWDMTVAPELAALALRDYSDAALAALA